MSFKWSIFLIMTLAENVANAQGLNPSTLSQSTDYITSEIPTTGTVDLSTIETTRPVMTTDRVTTDVRPTTISVSTEETTEPVKTTYTTENIYTTFSTTVRKTTGRVTTKDYTTEEIPTTLDASTIEPVKTTESSTFDASTKETTKLISKTTGNDLTTRGMKSYPQTSSSPQKDESCKHKTKTFNCTFKVNSDDMDVDKMVKQAYAESFLELKVGVSCSTPRHCRTSCRFNCDIDTSEGSYCESTMLIALVNGITRNGNTHNVDFYSLNCYEIDDRTKYWLKIMNIITGCLAVLVVLLSICIIMCICKKRNRRRKSNTKTIRMKKMTLRHTVKKFFTWNTESTSQDNEYTEGSPAVEVGSYNNGGLTPGIKLEVKHKNETDQLNVEPADEESDTSAPKPLERPAETLPRPNPRNPYLSVTDLPTDDPIYVNQLADDMRPKTKI